MRLLSEDDVRALLPTPLDCVDLVHDALVALAAGQAQAPPKPAVHSRPGSFANAMPAAWPARGLLGCKWISVFPDNPAAGLGAISGVMVVNDGATGVPRAVLPAGELTAARTAAVSGACLRALGPPTGGTGDDLVAITGAGVQTRSHLRVLAALGYAHVVVFARRREAGEALVGWAGRETPSLRLRVVRSGTEAAAGAAAVVTGLPIGTQGAQLDPATLREDVLLLPLDYATSVGTALAATATLATDDLEQFEAVRASGKLPAAYPRASLATGTLLERGRPAGRVVCQNLGTGVADLVVADAVARAAEASGAGHDVAGWGT